jgi:sensor histidine kinase regulating citrate/malate metabolism
VGEMTIARFLRSTMFSIFLLFGLVAVSTTALCVYTVDKQLSSQYVANSAAIAQTIANSSTDIILNRDMSTLQSLIDQFKEIQGVKYLYITNEQGEIIAHTFVPGVPKEIASAAPQMSGAVDRRLPGYGEFIEVSNPILDGNAGSAHVGMDKGFITLKIQTAIGQQIYLISIIFIVGIVGTFVLLIRAAGPLRALTSYAQHLAVPDRAAPTPPEVEDGLLRRKDEIGQLARLYRHLAESSPTEREPAP